MSDMRTLQATLARRLEDEPERVACRYVSGEGEATPVTVAKLLHRAMGYAREFGPADAGRQLVGVSLYPGIDLHAAFIGALWAGHIPTMLPPPSPRMEPTKYAESFRKVMDHLRPTALVIDHATRETLATLREYSGCPQLIQPDHVEDTCELPPAEGSPDAVALVQHSSGTTGLQKGIALSHADVLRHNASYRDRLAITRADVIVSWLPLYHDMGFIACFLLPLLDGIELVEIPTLDWVRRPVCLLEQINSHRGTLCWLPNFAFAFMADSVRDSQLSEQLDLRCLRAWVNCSEPVRIDSMRRFVARFARYGVTESQLTASYAMAENVFAVTQSEPGALRVLPVNWEAVTEQRRVVVTEDDEGVPLVSNGRLIPSTELQVLNEQGRPQGEDRVGELAIRGEHRFQGYFRRDDLTAPVITADGYYLTGDMGFVHRGEVYVTGRKKDMVIVGGKNLHPEDVEEIVNGVEGVKPGRVVAFGLRDEQSGTEQLVVLAEGTVQEPSWKRIELKIRQRIAQDLDVTAGVVRLVPARWLVKSTSGKPARGDNRRKFIATFAPSGDDRFDFL